MDLLNIAFPSWCQKHIVFESNSGNKILKRWVIDHDPWTPNKSSASSVFPAVVSVGSKVLCPSQSLRVGIIWLLHASQVFMGLGWAPEARLPWSFQPIWAKDWQLSVVWHSFLKHLTDFCLSYLFFKYWSAVIAAFYCVKPLLRHEKSDIAGFDSNGKVIWALFWDPHVKLQLH